MPLESPPPPDPRTHALFLDFDGTLVGFADDPENVPVRPGLSDALSSLAARFDGALALVSGRSLRSIDGLLAPLVLPAAGVHGLEVRNGGVVESNAAEADRLAPARGYVRDEIGPDDPIGVEDKGGAIVLHFRRCPDQAERATSIARRAASRDAGLVAVAGHAIAEIRPAAITKAGAIVGFMQRVPFAGRVPVFVGDDTTDEDGFHAADAAGGYGIKVGSGPTAARYRLDDVGAVHAWLGVGRDVFST